MTADEQQRRQIIDMVLRPQRITWVSRYLRDMCSYWIQVAIVLGVHLRPSLADEASATIDRGEARVPPCASQRNAAIIGHELAHLVCPEGDGRQFRYRDAGGHLNSPRGEIGAWRWAMAHAYRKVWTEDMHDVARESLDSYRKMATAEEREAINDFLRMAADRIQPAPDSFAGREQKLHRERVKKLQETSPLWQRLRQMEQSKYWRMTL